MTQERHRFNGRSFCGVGDSVAYQHDPLDRLRYVKWREGGVGKQTEYAYDEADNRTAQLDANSNATSWGHDAMDRMTEEEDAVGNARHFDYDGVGNVLRRVDAEGRVTTYERDATGNETARIYGGYQIGEGEKVETEYDTNANRKEVRTPLGEWRWKYDALNRMTGRDEPPIGIEDPNYPPLVTAWYYDHNGNVERLIGPDGGLTDYEYDERNRMTKVTRKDTESDPNPRITTYSYYENNLLKLKTLPNGCEAYHEYDELDRLTLLVNRKSDQTVISSFAIEYRDDDNKSKITREDGTVIEYDYDDQKRLTKEKWTAADQTVLHDFEYTYDAVGNRLTKVYNGVTTNYQYNNLNQLTEEQTGSDVTSYGYDREGNTIRKTEPAKETLYSWNPENMLTKAQFSDSTPTNEFGYDMDSVRVEKVDSEGRKEYHWDELSVLVERDGDSAVRCYAHGQGTPSRTGTMVVLEEGGETYAVGHDWLGSLKELTDFEETVVRTHQLDAWGIVLQTSGSVYTPYRFGENETDADTSLLLFRARQYDPTHGRFMSRDPFGEKTVLSAYAFGHRLESATEAGKINELYGGVPPHAVARAALEQIGTTTESEPWFTGSAIIGQHAYAYCESNPVNRIDPWGLWGHAEVHKNKTKEWAKQVGFCDKPSSAIAQADMEVDTHHYPDPYHMWRRQDKWGKITKLGRGPDPRPKLAEKHLQKAIGAAKDALRTVPKEASTPRERDIREVWKQLGTALHPLQDMAAHGDKIRHIPRYDDTKKTLDGAPDPSQSRLKQTEKATKDFLRKALKNEDIRRCLEIAKCINKP